MESKVWGLPEGEHIVAMEKYEDYYILATQKRLYKVDIYNKIVEPIRFVQEDSNEKQR